MNTSNFTEDLNYQEYLPPKVEIIDVIIEHGFAQSGNESPSWNDDSW